MAENDKPMQAWAGYYRIEDTGAEQRITEQELLDSVFSKLEKIQRRTTVEKIAQLEAQLAALENELTEFLER